MRKKTRVKQIVAVLLPIIFLLGIVLTLPKGNSLKADDSEQLFATVKLAGKTETLTDVSVKEDTIEVELTGKKTELIELPDDSAYEVFQVDEEGQTVSLPEKPVTELAERLEKNTVDSTAEQVESKEATASSTEATLTSEESEVSLKPEVFHVTNEDGQGKTYLQVVEDEPLTVVIQRKTDKEVPIVLTEAEGKEENKQQLFSFEEIPVEAETKNSGTENKVQAKTETEQSTVETEALEKDKETEIENSSKAEKDSAPKNDSEKAKDESEKTSSSETKEETEKGEIPKSNSELENAEEYEHVQFVETETTKKSLNELISEEYEENDSLRVPKFMSDKKTKQNEEFDEADGPIIIRDAKMTTKTGVASWDADNNPGHDKDDTNNIVRSYDRVSYLVSFSIQNNSKTENYKNIRYRVIASLDDAVEIVDNVPRNNGEVGNGTYIFTGDTGAQYSEGIMESVISDTGQVFVPVFMNVYGAPHGKKLKPTFRLELIEAENIRTREIETFNKSYDDFDFSNALQTSEVTVSAKPSVQVKLIKGDEKPGDVINTPNAATKSFDMGAVTVLSPLPERITATVKDDYRGSTFPTGEISYTIKHKGTYRIGSNSEQPMNTTHYTQAVLHGYAPAYKDRATAPWAGTGTIKTNLLTSTLSIPYAKTQYVHTSQPTGDLSMIGVYDSGNFSGGVTNGYNGTLMKNNNYVGTVNPYTYNMTGNRVPDTTAKSFSSLELVYGWNNARTENSARTGGWSNYTNIFYIDSISYDGITRGNDTSVSYPKLVTPSGMYAGGPTLSKIDSAEAEISTGNLIGINDLYAISQNSGNVQVTRGSQVYITAFPVTTNNNIRTVRQLLMWDPSAFKYDVSREPFAVADPHVKFTRKAYAYGVAKNIATTSPYTKTVKQIDTQRANYTWYASRDAALATGEISAMLFTVGISDESYLIPVRNVQIIPGVPIKAIGNVGGTSPAGKPLAVYSAVQFLNGDGSIAHQVPGAGATESYAPTTFNSSGGVVTKPNGYWNWLGESIYIRGFGINTKTEVERSLYQTNEEIKIKSSGIFTTGSSSMNYGSSLTVYLPKGINYKLGSSKDGLGNSLPDPSVIINVSGMEVLTWTFRDISAANGKLNTGVEVNYLATADSSQLTFQNTGYTNSMNVRTVGQMWETNTPSIKDTSSVGSRMSNDSFIEYLVQQVVLSKNANKPLIEVGDKDPIGTGTAITYEVDLINESTDDIINARLLDVLPFDNDGRGTKYSGSYTVTNVQVTGPTSTISFANSSIAYDTDPNTISGWTSYKPGVDPVSKIKDAKAILVSAARVKLGEKIKLKITIQPKDQKAGDVLVNNAQMNSLINLPVSSQAVWTRVYGRDLTGVAWYDDNYDGLIGNMDDGRPEDFAKDIPVKLYRTSLDDPSYQDKVVKESLTGEQWIDASGNSLNKTDEDGKYKFANLPEGTYVAEFIVNDRVVRKEVQVTLPDIGDDPAINSKASIATHKTPGYNQPVLADLPTETTPADPTYHVIDVNIGLIRSSRIRVYKFETGTAVDANNDGVLSDVEKASGRPIEGAEFTIYHEGEAQGTATTDETGFLLFDFFFRGDYTLIETKAPPGFELITYPLEVTIKEGNETIILYQENDPTTKLPFTGGNGPVRFFILAAGSIFLASFLGIAWHYRTPKKKGEA